MSQDKDMFQSDNVMANSVGNESTRKWLIGLIVLVVMVGGIVTLLLHEMGDKSANKTDETYTVTSDDTAIPSAPPIEVSQNNSAQDKPTMTPAQAAMLEEKQKALEVRLAAPLMLVSGNSTSLKGVDGQPALSVNLDPNLQFMAQAGQRTVEVSAASAMQQLNTLVAQGTLIHATLESAINSDLPGFIRASVSEPIYAEDGSTVLIPQGSRLIGEYKSGLLQGQSRIFVVWTRLMTPAGVTVNLGSAGVDSLGMAGIGADQIDRHFWQQFGKASLLSLIGAGASNVGGNGNDAASAYKEALTGSFSQSANQSLQQEGVVSPTLIVDQGKQVIVFVAKDLDFSHVPAVTASSLRVF